MITLRDWHGLDVAPPRVDRGASLPLLERFEAHVGMVPEAIAVATPEECLTRRELALRAESLASRIVAALPDGRAPVCVFASQGVVHLVGALACLRLGRPYVPLDPAQSEARNRLVAARAGGRVLVVPEGGGPVELRFAPRAIVLTEGGPGPHSPVLPPPPGDDVVVAVFFTSGSTGVPKGAMCQLGAFASTVAASIDASGQDDTDIYAYLGSPTVAGPLPAFYGALAVGARFVVAGSETPLPQALRLMADEGTTILHASIAMLRMVARHPGAESALRRIRLVRTMGDIIEWRDVHMLREVLPPEAEVYCGYAATECSMMAGWLLPHDGPSFEERVALGRPVEGLEAWIDSSLQGEGEADVMDELVVAGARLSPGYLDDPAATAASFVEHPDDPARHAYRTGDIVRLDAD